MATYGQNAEEFLLKEGILYVGTWNNPENIGADDMRPEAHFTPDGIIGYTKMGTTVVTMPRAYAEARTGTPSIIVRKDLIQKDLGITIENFQFSAELTQLLKGANSQLGYATADPAPEVWDIFHLGSDEPIQNARGYLLKSFLTDGSPFQVAIYFGRILTEANDIALSGTDYAVQPTTITAFPHPNFTDAVANAAQKMYGAIFHEVI